MRQSYLYAIAAGEPHLDLAIANLPADIGPPAAISSDRLTAIVSDYDGPIFADLPPADLLRYLAGYQQVIDQVIEKHRVLPVKFGTLVPSRHEVKEILVRYGNRLMEALAEVGDALEIDLSATWDLSTVLADIAQDPPVAALAGAAADATSEEALAARVQVGMLVQQTLGERRETYRRRIVGDLVGLARDAEPHPTPTDELVVNCAFLVDRSELPRFEAAVDRLGEELGDILSFRYVGPLPPYSFATVELTRPNVAEIESARRLLNLGDRVSDVDLRNAYREGAAWAHPDRNHGDEEAQARFATLGAARDTLRAYLRGQRTDERLNEEQRIDMRSSAVVATTLLEIRRTDADLSARSTPRE